MEATNLKVSHKSVSPLNACVLDQQAPVRKLADAIGSKWARLCIYALEDGPVRFNELERRLSGVSQKVLTQTLRKLERSGLVERTVFAEVPPRVQYALTPLGFTLQPLTSAMCTWSNEHGDELQFGATS
jgi:DNA-binding HxlR family transcriptional regulator